MSVLSDSLPTPSDFPISCQPQLGMPVLYSFRRCPYAMRARLALVAAGVNVEIREIALRAKPPHMLALSPKGTVPVLWLPNGEVVDQSLDIMRWAIGQRYPTTWIAEEELSDVTTREAIQAILEDLDGPFKFHLDRYKYPNRYENCDAAQHLLAGLKILQKWNALLSDSTGGYFFGNRPSVADVAVFPFVRQFRIADEAKFDQLPGIDVLHRWLMVWLSSVEFDVAMQKYECWQPGDPAVVFPAR